VELIIAQTEWTWIGWVYMLVVSGVLFFTGGITRTYFCSFAQSIFMCFTLLNFWMGIIFALASFFAESNGGDFFEFYFAGSILFVIIIAMKRDKDWENYLCDNESIKVEQDVLKLVIIFANIVLKYVENIEGSASILKGYMMRHVNACQRAKCVLKAYSNGYLELFDKKERTKINEEAFKAIKKALLSHCEEGFLIGISKFPSDNKLKIFYADYLINVADNKGAALEKLELIESYNPNFEEKAIIYIYKAQIKDFLLSKKDDKEQLSITSLMTYKSHLKIFNDQIEVVAQLHCQFWSVLLEDAPDLTLLKNYGFEIQDLNESIKSHWEAMQRINPDSPNALKLYSIFLADVMNDKEHSNELIEALKKIDVLKINILKRKTEAANSCDVQAIAFNGDPCICISGKTDNLGYVTHCNLAMCRLFGYTQKEMLRLHVNDLMPELYANDHMKVLTRTIEHPETRKKGKKEFNVPIKTKSGYIVTIFANLLSHPTLLNEDNFIALMRVDKAASSYDTITLLLDLNNIVVEMSSTGEFFLGKLYNVKKARIPLSLLCPDIVLNQESPKKFEVTTDFYPIYMLNEDEDVKNVKASPIKVHCTIETAEMESKKIGYFVKLLVVREVLPPPMVEPPNPFVFIYDKSSNKYLRRYGNVSLNLEDKKVFRESYVKETHSHGNLETIESKKQREEFTLVELLQNTCSRMELCKGHYFKKLIIHIQNMIKVLNSKEMNVEDLKINKELKDLLKKDYIDYKEKVRTYRLIGDEMIYIDDNNIDVDLLLDDSENEVAHKITNRVQQIMNKKSLLLFSANIKGKRSLENTLVQDEKIKLKLTYLGSYLLFVALFILTIVSYIFLRSFLDELLQKMQVVNSSYERIIYGQVISFEVFDIYFTQL